VIFAFALLGERESGRSVAPGILWVAIAFAGTLGLSRIAARELEGDCLVGIATSPASRGAIFLGKLIASLLFLLAMELLLVPLVCLLFDLDLLPQLTGHLLGLFLGSVGFCALGTLFSTMLLNARLRDVLLPLVFYPLVAPVLIAGVKITTLLLAGELDGAATWLKLLFAFDVVFTMASAWAFGWTLGE